MKKNMLSVLMASTLGVVHLGALNACVFAQSPQLKRKPTQEKSMAQTKATAVPLSPDAITARRTLYAQSDRLLAQARVLLKEGDLAGADLAAHRALEATPVLNGEKQPRHTIPLLLGDIALRRGKYQDALGYYLPAGRNTLRSGLSLDVALCYARLGNYQKARQFYSDQAVLQYSFIQPQDLPGTRSPQMLEASILLAHGVDAFFSDQNQKALTDFDAALKLAPKNGLIAYYAARSLINMNRTTEAGPYFVQAAENGRGKIAEKAKGFAATYLRNQERLKSQPQNAAKSRP